MQDSKNKKIKVKAGSFQSMGLEKELLQGLTRMGYKEPTPVQRKALPVVLAGLDVVCMARTGSGKTCVFLLPMVQKLKAHQSSGGVRGLVLSPTRELAVQTYRFAVDMAKFTNLRIIDILGGDSMQTQFDALASKPDIIIATPGRLMHHLKEIPNFHLKSIQYLVFDEADRLFEMGFAEQLHEIVKECASERQTLLFSATLPKMIVQFSRAGLKDPQLVRLDTDIKMSEELRLGFFLMRSNEKLACLLYVIRNLLSKSSTSSQQTIIFTATKHHSELIHALLSKLQYSCTMIYGSMDQELRHQNLKAFRKGDLSFLIVTDVAARGIDVPLLNNVINFHFPASPKLFVHRCGRAARQGRIGFAFSFIEPDEFAYLMDVHQFLNKSIDSGYPKSSQNSDHSAAPESESYDELAPYAYTLSSMTPDMMHTGLLPQDALDEENDYVKRLLQEDDNIATLYRIAENGYQQYKRTRSEASRQGVKAAKLILKNDVIQTIHPLIKGCDPHHCSKEVLAKAEFIRKLQTFRPHATVLETGIGTGSSTSTSMDPAKKAEKFKKSLAIMKDFRRATLFHLERNKAKLIAAKDTEGDNEDQCDDSDDSDEEVNDDENIDVNEDELGDDNDEYHEVPVSGNGVKGNDEHDESDDLSVGLSVTSAGRETRRLSAAERRKLRKFGTRSSSQQDEDQRKTKLASFQDSKFYMTYGTESTSETFAEESLQPLSNLRSGETFGKLVDVSYQNYSAYCSF